MGCTSSKQQYYHTAEHDEQMDSVVFLMVNGTSGGNVAKQLLDLESNEFKFKSDSGKRIALWIYDLRNAEDRKLGFENIAMEAKQNNPGELRVIACGGDGTVKWVISELVKINCLKLPIGVIPFGTGNDFSRMLGWGGSAPQPLIGKDKQVLFQRIAEFAEAEVIKMDCWKADIYLEDSDKSKVYEIKSGKITETYIGQKKISHEMINYISFGFDAQIMYEFEQQRTTSQLGNKIVLARKGLTISKPARLRTMLESLETIRGDQIKTRGSDKLLLFSNIPSYSAGTNPWRRRKDDKNLGGSRDGFRPQFIGDKTLECVTVRRPIDSGITIATGGVSKGGIRRTAQEDGFIVNFKEGASIYLQIDGEAMHLERISKIEIKHGFELNVIKHKHAIAFSLPVGYIAETDKNVTEAEDCDFADSDHEEEDIPANDDDSDHEVAATEEEKPVESEDVDVKPAAAVEEASS